jgi:hypothetical protein
MEFQNVYVLQFVKSFIIYYIKFVYPRIWVSRVYVARVEKKNALWDISTKSKIGIL